ncbi:MAG TPA: zf-HC2 domain-containing protein [Nitrospirota bacterium]
MKCAKTKLASPYIDNELSEKDRELFEAHLTTCPECGARVRALQKTRGLFCQAEHYQAPYGFSTRVVARAKAEEKNKWRRFLPVVARLAEVAIVLVMISVGILAGRFVMTSVMHQRMGNMASTFSLDLFDPVPPGSVGGAYLAMTEAHHEQ